MKCLVFKRKALNNILMQINFLKFDTWKIALIGVLVGFVAIGSAGFGVKKIKSSNSKFIYTVVLFFKKYFCYH